MARDKVGRFARLKARRAIIDGLIASHRGRVVNTAADSVVADFASAVDAVQCAVAVQTAIATENARAVADGRGARGITDVTLSAPHEPGLNRFTWGWSSLGAEFLQHLDDGTP